MRGQQTAEKDCRRGPAAPAPRHDAGPGAGRGVGLLRGLLAAAVLGAIAGLSACGGEEGASAPAGPSACDLGTQRLWLSDYLDEWYLWADRSPRPGVTAFNDLDAYLAARLYPGGDPSIPPDLFSGSQPAADFDRFYDEGRTLGYGLAVAGLEIVGRPDQPLLVRLVEARSPAAAAGVQRGDEVLSLNGRPAAQWVAANDFAPLTATTEGQRLQLRLARGAQTWTVDLQAAVFDLTPVPAPVVLPVQTASGLRRVGVLSVKDMIPTAEPVLERHFAWLKTQDVDDLVVDLRYNGGGRVATGAMLAAHIAGARGAGRDYVQLRYNARRSPFNDQTIRYTVPPNALGLSRVYVLVGRRTCSASEQVINGMRGAGIEVHSVGETTCGKPVGSLPATACGRTWSVVNFESFNHLGQGRYFDGLPATCGVAEDWRQPQDDPRDPLLAAALQMAGGGRCPQAAGQTGGLRLKPGPGTPVLLR